MSMDGMTMEGQVRAAGGLSHVGCDVNKSSNATTDRMQVCSSLHFCARLRASRHSRNCPTMVSPLLRMCLSSYTLLRSHLSLSFVREFLYQEVLYLHLPSINFASNSC